MLRFGVPDIMNSDQGIQFTFFACTGLMKRVDARISMGGKRRSIDNIFIACLCRSLK